jgi:1-aminocyclopropane-1-carboxylate deaminase/D-cysteine desulfhydrase-like pyridoxal-dependent ACC family enzyme
LLEEGIQAEIVTVPCTIPVAEEFLVSLQAIDRHTGNHSVFPRLLKPEKAECGGKTRKYRFAAPSPELYSTWDAVRKQTDIEFDLVYAPRTFEVLMRSDIWIDERINLLYYHCGGLEGNDSMLARYQHAGIR